MLLEELTKDRDSVLDDEAILDKTVLITHSISSLLVHMSLCLDNRQASETEI